MPDFVERLKASARLGGSGDSQADIARDLTPEVRKNLARRVSQRRGLLARLT